MTDRKLTTADVQGLAAVFDAAARSAKVARALATGDVIYGTARGVGDESGAVTDVDFRDRFLRVTSTAGFEHFWPVSHLAEEVLDGRFAVDYEPPVRPLSEQLGPEYKDKWQEPTPEVRDGQ